MLGSETRNDFQVQTVQRCVWQECLSALGLIMRPFQMLILLFCIEPFRKDN